MKTEEEIHKIVQGILKDTNGSWSDMVTEGYDAGYKDAMEEYRNQSVPTTDKPFTEEIVKIITHQHYADTWTDLLNNVAIEWAERVYKKFA